MEKSLPWKSLSSSGKMALFNCLRENGVEEATEADTFYIVRYFDSDHDEALSYEDLLQLFMPCDD
jgi:hypothetical protein